MSEHEVRMVVLSTDDLDESIRLYSETLGMPLKFRDGAHFAALHGGAITLALATAADHPTHGQVVVGIKTADVDAAAKAVDASGGRIVQGAPTTTHTNAVPWSTTTKATGWSFTVCWPREDGKPRPVAGETCCPCLDSSHWWAKGDLNPCLDQAKYSFTCGFVPCRSISVPLVTCGFVFES